jgi:hypothetical protein
MGSVDGQPTAGMKVGPVHLTTKIAGMALVFAAALFLSAGSGFVLFALGTALMLWPYRLFPHVW